MSEPTLIQEAMHPTFLSIEAAQERCEVTRRGERDALSEWVRINVLMRDGFTCRWCGLTGEVVPLHIDHIVPWSAGGTDGTSNLRALCDRCNLDRSNRRTDSETARTLTITSGCNTCCPDWDGDGTGDLSEVAVWCAWCREVSTTSRDARDSAELAQIEHRGYAAPGVAFDRTRRTST